MSNNFMNLLSVKSPNHKQLMKAVGFALDKDGFFSLKEIRPVPVDFLIMVGLHGVVLQAKLELESELGVVLLSDIQRIMAKNPINTGESLVSDVGRIKSLYRQHGYCCYEDWAVANWGVPCEVAQEAGFEDGGFCFVSKGLFYRLCSFGQKISRMWSLPTNGQMKIMEITVVRCL